MLGGIFPFVDTHGIPLEVILGELHRRGNVPDWYGFWTDAMKAGWKPGPTRTKIATAVGEVQGPKVRERVQETLDFLVKFEGGSDDEKLQLLKDLRVKHKR